MYFFVSNKRWYCQIDEPRGYCVGKCQEIRVMGDSLQTKGRWNCESNLGHVSRLNESAEEQHSSMHMQLTNITVHIVQSIITSPMSHLNIARNALIDIILFHITIKWYRSW